MNFLYSEHLCCPLDQRVLRVEGTQLRCENGHSFDIARQGYVNLLGAADKRSRDPGDSRDMVEARREFLNSGHYQPVAHRLADIVKPLVSANATIVDAGCGEGYYLQQLQSQLESTDPFTPSMIGFDISRWAVRSATRRLVATWLVASNRSIPLAPRSTDCLLSLFGFPVFESFRRLLKKEGVLLTVSPGRHHLIELREMLYPRIKHSESTLVQQARAAGFSPGETSTLQYETAPLSQIEISQLLRMTPHLFRTSREGKERAALLEQFPVTVDVVFQLLHHQ